MRRILALLLLLTPAVAWAEPFVLDLPPGVHNLSITVAADGTVSARPLRTVTVGGKPTDPVDPDPVDPTPDLTGFAAEVKLQTSVVIQAGGSRTTGAALSAVYGLVGEGVEDGSIPIANAFTAVKAGSDAVLAKQADGAKWTAWRATMSKALSDLHTAGKLGTAKQIASTFAAISKGIDQATGSSLEPRLIAKIPAGAEFAFDTDGKADGILDGINLRELIALIKEIIDILKAFGLIP